MNDLKETIRRYFKNRNEIVAVYLFGSHAAGKEKRFSDVDIGVILYHRELKNSINLQGQYAVALGRKLRKDIHTVIMNSAGEVLLKQIFSKGECVCVNNETEFKQFKMTRFSMISEFGYYLEMTQTGFHRQLVIDRAHGR